MLLILTSAAFAEASGSRHALSFGPSLYVTPLLSEEGDLTLLRQQRFEAGYTYAFFPSRQEDAGNLSVLFGAGVQKTLPEQINALLMRKGFWTVHIDAGIVLHLSNHVSLESLLLLSHSFYLNTRTFFSHAAIKVRPELRLFVPSDTTSFFQGIGVSLPLLFDFRRDTLPAFSAAAEVSVHIRGRQQERSNNETR